MFIGGFQSFIFLYFANFLRKWKKGVSKEKFLCYNKL